MKIKYTIACLLLLNSILSFSQVPSIKWAKTYGGSGDDQARAVEQTSDGGYIVAGLTNSDNGNVTGHHFLDDYWIVKLSPNGKIVWEKALGGSELDFANAVRQTKDGGYIVAGASRSNDGDVSGNHGDDDFWIVKLSSSGSVQWKKTYGGPGDEVAQSIDLTADNGYIIAGSTQSDGGDVSGTHGGTDYWVVKIDSAGNLQWQKALGGSGNDFATSAKQTSDGGYVVVGGAGSTDDDVTGNHGMDDYWVVKLDMNGNVIWQKAFGGTLAEDAYSVVQTSDNGYVIAGSAYSNNGNVTGNHGNGDYWVVKLNSNGNLVWQKALGGSDYDIAFNLSITKDGGTIISGTARSDDGDITDNHGNYDYWLVRLNKKGNLQWTLSLGGSDYDEAYGAQQTIDGGYIVAGFTFSTDGQVTGNHGNNDFWVVKLMNMPVAFEDKETTPSFAEMGAMSSSQYGAIDQNTLIFHIKIEQPLITSATIQLMNLAGEIMLTKEVAVSNGIISENIPIDFPLSSGLYLLQVRTGGEQRVIKIIAK